MKANIIMYIRNNCSLTPIYFLFLTLSLFACSSGGNGDGNGGNSIANKSKGPFDALGFYPFAADDSPTTLGNSELWLTDGTSAGTRMVKDIHPNLDTFDDYGSTPRSFVQLHGKLYFVADDSVHGREPWVSDGTESGTQLLKDINSAVSTADSSYPTQLMEFNGKLIFFADDGVHGMEPWISDGTATGTMMLADINENGDSWLDIGFFVELRDSLLIFSADDGVNGERLWRTDGTPEGTKILSNRDINVCSIFYPIKKLVFDKFIYFSASEGDTDCELWASDGTDEGTQLVKDINQTGSSTPSNFIVMNDIVFFSADDGVHHEEAWVSDGTPKNTRMLKDINTNNETVSGDSFPSQFTVFDNQMYFSAVDGVNGPSLWKTDGTEQGTIKVKSTFIGGDVDSKPRQLTVLNGLLYFEAYDGGMLGSELWVSDGTEEGTYILKDINPLGNSYPDYFEVFDGKLIFIADDGVNGSELWVSDGTEAGTFMLKNVNGGPGDSVVMD